MANVTCELLEGQWGYIIKSDARSAILMYYSGWTFAVGREGDGDLKLLSCQAHILPQKSFAYGEKLAKTIKKSFEEDKPFKGRVNSDPAKVLLIDMAGQLLCPEYMTKGTEVLTFDGCQYIIRYNGLTAVSLYTGSGVSALVQIVDDRPVVMCSNAHIGGMRDGDEYRIEIRDLAIKAFTTGTEIEKKIEVSSEINEDIENAAMKFLEENDG